MTSMPEHINNRPFAVPGSDAPAPEIHPGSYEPQTTLESEIVAALRSVHDPEIPVNIYDLGLIYRMTISEDGVVALDMTLTAPGCPVAGEMPGQVATAVETVAGVQSASVTLVWEPAWNKDRMSEDARLALGFL